MSKALKLAEYYAFVEYMATPGPLRELKTQGDFQVAYNVSADTLARWKKDPHFWEDVSRATESWTKERTPAVLGALFLKAVKNGNVPAIRLWLQYVEKFQDRIPEIEMPDQRMPDNITDLFKLLENEEAKDLADAYL